MLFLLGDTRDISFFFLFWFEICGDKKVVCLDIISTNEEIVTCKGNAESWTSDSKLFLAAHYFLGIKGYFSPYIYASTNTSF